MVTTSPSVVKAEHPSKLRQFLERNYALDLRSLSLYRVFFGLLLLTDLLVLRLPDLRAHYSDFGILPRQALIESFSHPWFVSFHLISGQWQVQFVLFMIAAVFALMLMLGYKTRFAAIASWLMLMSLQNRIEAVMQGGDTLMRAMAWWAMFVPLNAYWSVDAALDNSGHTRPEKNTVLTGGTAGLFSQSILLYCIAAMLKSGAAWRTDGTAVWFALSLDQMTTPLGHWMLNFPVMLKYLTFFTLAVEFLAPLFLLIPFLSGPIRTNAVLILIGLQLSFRACLNAGHFAFVASILMLPLLPSWFWKRFHAGDPESWWWGKLAAQKKLAIYFDGGCDFCRKIALIMREFLLSRETPLIPSQDAAATHDEMRRENSWIVVNESGQRFYRTAALAEVCRHSLILAPFAWLLSPRPVQELGDDVYRVIERNRPRLSRWVGFLKPKPLNLHTPKWAGYVAAASLLYIIWWNLHTVNEEKFPLSPTVAAPGILLRLDQNWGMFAPSPLNKDGWYVIPGRLRDRTQVDLFRNGAPVDLHIRNHDEIYAQYPNERWRKYMMNLQTEPFAPYRVHYGRYLCRWWNEGRSPYDPKLLLEFDIYFYERFTMPPGVPKQQYVAKQLHKHYCFEPPKDSKPPAVQP